MKVLRLILEKCVKAEMVVPAGATYGFYFDSEHGCFSKSLFLTDVSSENAILF